MPTGEGCGIWVSNLMDKRRNAGYFVQLFEKYMPMEFPKGTLSEANVIAFTFAK